MENFSRIFYIDAKYISEDVDYNYLSKIKLDTHEAYGYIEKNKDGDIVLRYIINTRYKNFLVEGLVLPIGAVCKDILIKDDMCFEYNLLKNSRYEIYWKDIVHVVGQKSEVSVSKMVTTGQLILFKEDFVIIKNPVTLRIYLEPIINHLSFTPFYYVIPKSFIYKINQIH